MALTTTSKHGYYGYKPQISSRLLALRLRIIQTILVTGCHFCSECTFLIQALGWPTLSFILTRRLLKLILST
jgi:hypothetical protein